MKKHELYLLELARHGGRLKIEEVCARVGFAVKNLDYWRKKPGENFREREEAALAAGKALAAAQAEQQAADELAAAQAGGETAEAWRHKLFLEYLHETDDRVEAAERAGIDGGWPAVEDAMKTSAALAAGFKRWQRRMAAKLEDAVARKGVGGDTSSARAWLQAHDPRYRRQLPAGKGDDGELDEAAIAAEKERWRPGGAAPLPEQLLDQDPLTVEPEDLGDPDA